jgi:hypothetical protein
MLARKIFLTFAVVMFALAAAPVSRALADARGNCTTNKTSFSTVSSNFTPTTSTAFEPMAGMRTLVTTTAAGCVVVDFSAEFVSFAITETPLLRVMIVGRTTPAEPGNVVAGQPVSTQTYETRATKFVFPSLPAGTYNIRVEWRSQNGNEVRARRRTMTVQYR